MQALTSTPLAWPEESLRSYKYREVWMRALVKIRAGASVALLGQDIKLFGSDTLRGDKTADLTQPDLARKLIQRRVTVIPSCAQSKWVLLPSSKWRLAWSLIYVQLMLYTAFVMPYRMAFYEDIKDEWFILDNVVNALFAVDIGFTLNTAFYNNEGELVTRRKAIFLNYFKSWLIIDAIACFPFNAVGSQDTYSEGGSNQVSGLVRLLRLPRLYRLVRLTRVFSATRKDGYSRLFDQFQELVSVKHSSFRLVLFLASAAVAIHLMACLWYYMPVLEGLSPDTWLYVRSLQDSTNSEIYVNCLYWTVTTLATVGYGDIVPTTVAEKVVAMCWMLFGVFFFSFVVSSLASLLSSVDTKRTLLSGKLAAIDEFAEEAKLSKDLRFRLRHALRYSTIHTGFSGQVKKGIFNELPRALRFEVAVSMHHGAAKSIPFFNDRDQAFVAATVPFLNSLLVPEGEAVYTEGDYADEIYFIAQGTCMVMFNAEVVMKKLQRGSYFGEVEVFLATARKYTVQAGTRTDMLSMNKKVLSTIQSDFPTVYEDLKEVARVRNHLNDGARQKFKKLFSATVRMPRRRTMTRTFREAGAFLEHRESKKTMPTTEERLDEIEDNIKEVRKTLDQVLEGQRLILQQQTFRTQESQDLSFRKLPPDLT